MDQLSTLKQLWDEHVKGTAGEHLLAVHKNGKVYEFVSIAPNGAFIGWEIQSKTPAVWDDVGSDWKLYVAPIEMVPHYRLMILEEGGTVSEGRELMTEATFERIKHRKKSWIALDKSSPVMVPMRGKNYVLANGLEVEAGRSYYG